MIGLIELLRFPVDNLAGMFIYALLFMLAAGLIAVFILRFVSVPYFIKNGITGTAVFIGLYIWWKLVAT